MLPKHCLRAHEPWRSHQGMSQRCWLCPAGAGDELKDLPFSIPAPASHKDFLKLVEGQDLPALAEIVRRIRACNAIALAAGNRRKMQV